jgi:SAM-dependent methyltransferase
MFLGVRTTQAEYFDAPERTPAERRDCYAWLARVNRLTRFERPFRVWIPRLIGSAHCRDLTLLDLGAGDGSLGRTLTAWAATQGWRWKFTNLDLHPQLEELNPGGANVRGSVLDLPFADDHFDVVVANTMTHHLDGPQAVATHFREAHRVARRATLLCDLQRNAWFYGSLALLLTLWRAPRDFRSDGLISVRRGWRAAEWRALAQTAGLPDARVWEEHGARVLLATVKPPSPARAGTQSNSVG